MTSAFSESFRAAYADVTALLAAADNRLTIDDAAVIARFTKTAKDELLTMFRRASYLSAELERARGEAARLREERYTPVRHYEKHGGEDDEN